jgi:hypothetical protein
MAQMMAPTPASGEMNRISIQSSACPGSTGSPQKIAANAAAKNARVIANFRRLRGLYPGRLEHKTHCHRFQKPTGISGTPWKLSTLNVRT